MKRTNGHIGIVLLLAAGLLAGCAGSGDEPTTVSENTPKEIRLNANVWRVMDGTRTTYYDNTTALETEGSFTCSAYEAGTTTGYFTGAAVEWDSRVSSDWAFATAKYWPLPVSNAVPSVYPFALDFFAYAPATPPAYIAAVNYAVSGEPAAPAPYFTCDMTQTIDKEFVWALTPGQTKDTNGGTVDMAFKHPFARISFEKNAASDDVTINYITLSVNPYKTGTCTFDGTTSTWSSLGGAASLGSLSTGTPYLVIPDNYGTMTITVNATWDDGLSTTEDITSGAVAIDWQPGFSYTYSLTITKFELIVDTTKYTEQW